MASPHKIIIIGVTGFRMRSERFHVDSFAWNKLAGIPDLRDYDTVLLSLLSRETVAAVPLSILESKLNLDTASAVLRPGGRIVVIGDPRFELANSDQQFLEWTGVTFYWDDAAGNTLERRDAYKYREYDEYIRHIHHWDYSLRSCESSVDFVNRGNEANRDKATILETESICRNRYHHDIVFTINFVIVRQERSSYGDRKTPLLEFGPIIFLPKITLSEPETIELVLRDIFKVPLSASEPEWVSEIVAPGQAPMDVELNALFEKVDELTAELDQARARLRHVRSFIGLLYQQGLVVHPLRKARFWGAVQGTVHNGIRAARSS